MLVYSQFYIDICVVLLNNIKKNVNKIWSQICINLHGYLVIKFSVFSLLQGFPQLSRVMRKPDFRLCENKGADQLCSNCTSDQRLCFRYTDCTLSPLLIPKVSRI